jgi:two-component system nitrogen regulation sensor histidine kinase GlnL
VTPERYDAFDLLATLVALARPDGTVLFANTGFEAAVGLSRRALVRTSLFDRFVDPAALRETLLAVARNEMATGRLEATLKVSGAALAHEELPVHVIVTQVDPRGDSTRPAGSELVLVEMLEVEQQTRQDREERALDQIRVNRELIRNLAHEIKNPLGGIRGAAQLLAMEVTVPELTEYTEVIVHEADRLQALVDRLLAPHRRPHLVSDVNIHEVCERVRSVVLAEFPRGLTVVRDYDAVAAGVSRRSRATDPGAAQHRAERGAGAWPAHRRRQCMHRAAHARRAPSDDRQAAQQLALELHVEDNGPGVPESIRDRIFFPLVSGREAARTRAHAGADVRAAASWADRLRSVPGRTVFKIVIPLP